VIFLMLYMLIRYGSFFAGWWVISILVSSTEEYGLNIWLARILAVPFAFLFILGGMWMLAFRERKRIKGAIIFGATLIAYFSGIYYLENSVIYGVDRQIKKCVALDGMHLDYEFVPCNWKITPWGTPVVAPTPEIIIQINSRKHPQAQKIVVERFCPDENSRFFSTDGTPLIWFHLHPDNRLEFFKRPGFHPQKPSVRLQPVNNEAYELFMHYCKNNKKSMIIGCIESRSAKEEIPQGESGLKTLRDFLAEVNRTQK
jgi:hypothetical protein